MSHPPNSNALTLSVQGYDGFHFAPGDAASAARSIRRALAARDDCPAGGADDNDTIFSRARRSASQRSWVRSYQEACTVYSAAIGANGT